MVANEQLLSIVLERLQPLPVTARSMFGGSGLYFDGKFFAVIFDGVLYFRTDDESRASYTSRGMKALQPKYRPRGPKTVDRHFEVPPGVLRNAKTLRDWAVRASQVQK